MFSLNGRDSLDENKTLHDLGIVGGDLLHVIQEKKESSETPSDEKQLHIRPGSEVEQNTANQTHSCSHVHVQNSALNPVMECRQDLQHHSVAPTATRVPNGTSSNRNHFEQFLREQLQADVSSGAAVLSLALHALMLDLGFLEQEV